MYKYRVDIALFLALGSDCREEEIIRQQGRTVLVLRYLLTLSITAIMKAKVLKHSGPFSVTKLGNSLFFFFFLAEVVPETLHLCVVRSNMAMKTLLVLQQDSVRNWGAEGLPYQALSLE